MKKLFLLFSLFISGLILISCKDDDDVMIEDTFAPIVTFNTPSNGTTVFAGDTIVFSITAVDNVSLKTMNLSGSLGFMKTITSFDSTASHTEEFNGIIDTATLTGLYDVTMSATDNSGNTGERTIDLTVVH